MAWDVMLVRYTKPLLPADLRRAGDAILFFRRVEKIGHDGVAGGTGPLVVVQRDNLRYPGAAQEDRVIVTVAVRFLHDYLVLQAIDGLRHGHGRDVVGILQAGGGGKGDRPSRA